MKIGFFALLILLLGMVSTACVPNSTTFPDQPTETTLPTQTLTPTIVWFPPTATYTPLPTPAHFSSPTPDLAPQHGALLFQDDFSDPEKWTSEKQISGSISLGTGELTLVVIQPRGYLYSLYVGEDLEDFYAEVTASPSLCRGDDEYGLLFRFSSSQDLFRFALDCKGYASVARILQSQASAPQPPIISGAIPPGAPSSSRLGVWAVGREMRFFVNEHFLFTVMDASLLAGDLGVFVRAAGEETVTVNFSNLEVYSAPE